MSDQRNGRTRPRIGICQWALPTREIAGIAFAKKIGYEGVELDMGLKCPRNDLRNSDVLRDICHAVSDFGIDTPSLALNDLRLTDPYEEKATRSVLDEAMDIACALSARTIQLSSFGASCISDEQSFAATVRTLSHACERAAAYGIVIGSENQLSVRNNMRLLEEVGAGNMRVYFDVANPIVFDGRDAIAMLNALYDVICEIHVKDYRYLGDSWKSVSLGHGDCRCNEAMESIRNLGYTNWIMAEGALEPAQLVDDAIWLERFFAQGAVEELLAKTAE